MRLITKETDYAIRAVANLARRPGAFVSSAEISAEEGIPLRFLRRILQRLLKAGLVVSREGVAGGVSLKAEPRKIRMLDIMKVFQGDVALSECMFRKRLCANRRTCVLRRHMKEIERNLAAQFAGISVADLLRGQTCKPAEPNTRGRPVLTRSAQGGPSKPTRSGAAAGGRRCRSAMTKRGAR